MAKRRTPLLTAESQNKLVAMQRVSRVPSLARAVSALLHEVVPPLRGVAVVCAPLEDRVRLVCCVDLSGGDPGSSAAQPTHDVWQFLAAQPRRPVVRLAASRVAGPNPGSAPSRGSGALLNVWEGLRLAACVWLDRGPAHGEFSSAEMRRLRAAHPHVSAAVKRVLQDHLKETKKAALEQISDGLSLGVVLLDWELQIVYANPAAADCCAHWDSRPVVREPRRGRVVRLPPAVLEAARELRDSGSDGTGLIWSAHPGQGRCRLSVVRPGDASTQRLLLLRFEGSLAENPIAVSGAVVERHRLTPREWEIGELVCAGRTNREIALALRKSTATVRNQLHGIFDKLGLARRAELAAQWR